MKLTCAILLSALASAQTNVRVPMRDGVRLSTDVYLPDTQGRHPVIVTRSPYNKNGERSLGTFFAKNGFVFVAQDVRGRYESEGRLRPVLQEPEDGYDTIEWAAAQPWSNGNVGTTGASYLAMDQLSAATLRPPHLRAMYLAVGSGNYYRDAAYKGGVRSTGWPVWLLFAASAKNKDLAKIIEAPAQWLKLPTNERERSFEGFPDLLEAYRDFYAHPTFDDYWNQRGYAPATRLRELPDIPMLFLTGWYDMFTDATIDNFTALAKAQKTEKRLIVGPWPHAYGKTVCGNAAFPEAAFNEREVLLEWFSTWLKHEKHHRADPIRYFRMGGDSGAKNADGRMLPGGEWMYTRTWPPPSREHVVPIGEASYTFDPADPAPTVGGRYANGCIQDQKTGRPDILHFVGAPLSESLEVTGRISATLRISADPPDADLIVKVIDVFPNGYAMNVAEGQARTTRKGEIAVDVGNTSMLFGRGHRIRIDITSSSFPRLDINDRPKSRITMLKGSRVVLPVI